MLKRLLKHFSRREKQTTFVAIGALRVNGRELHDYTTAAMVDVCVRNPTILVFGQICIGLEADKPEKSQKHVHFKRLLNKVLVCELIPGEKWVGHGDSSKPLTNLHLCDCV